MHRSTILALLLTAVCSITVCESLQAQDLRFRVDLLGLQRDGETGAQPLISGPDSLSANSDYDFESGIRLMFGLGTDVVDLEFQFTGVGGWGDEERMTLGNVLAFDAEFMNPLVVGAAANLLTFDNLLTDAGNFNGGGLLDETTEGEILESLSTAIYQTETRYDDFEVTLKQPCYGFYRFGVGYRHIRFDEADGLRINGTFGAIDADDGAVVGDATNGPNDILSDEALTFAGLTAVGGLADGFAHGDALQLSFKSSNRNVLNGGQVTFDALLFENDVFLLEGLANLGIYNNSITSSFDEAYLATGSNRSAYRDALESTRNELAWTTQGGLRAAVKLTDFVRMHVGYEVLFIDGLAIGPNYSQVPTVPRGSLSVEADDSVVIHGGRVGIEAIW